MYEVATYRIKLQFSTEANIGSKILHYYDHVWASHVDAVLTDGKLLGAKYFGGVMARRNVGFTKTLLVELPTDQRTHDAFYDFCYAQVGKPYDMGAIIAFAFERDWQQHDSWFCSELIAAALQESGFLPYPLFAGHNKITPQNLLIMCNMFTPIHHPIIVSEMKYDLKRKTKDEQKDTRNS